MPNQEEDKLFESGDILPLTAENAPSRGSIGHPFNCAAGCKYIKKPRGCKDGADCERCHLCAFKNSKTKKAAKEEPWEKLSPPAAAARAASPPRARQAWRGRR